MTIPPSIFSPCHGVVPLRPRLENWMAELLQDRPRLDALTVLARRSTSSRSIPSAAISRC